MRCPNCDYEYNGSNGNTCPNCRVDTVLFTKTAAVSDALYNKGLGQARSHDMSGAINSLLKAIEFNKNNIAARNLIGLCYYEIGYIGDALKHWVISNSILKEKNPARRYIENVQNDEQTLERLTESVNMYNQALEYLKQKSDDIAIIQLKRAVELNPKFVDAHNLLAFCHLIQNDKVKAVSSTERALALDVNNPIATNYHNQLFGSKPKAAPIAPRPQTVPRPAARSAPAPDYREYTPRPPSYRRMLPGDNKALFGKGLRVGEIIFFAFGALLVFIFMAALYVPQKVKAVNAQVNELTSQKSHVEQQLMAAAADFETRKAQSDKEYKELEDQYEQLRGQFTDQVLAVEVTRAETMAANGDYRGAADALAGLDGRELSGELAVRAANAKTGAWRELVKEYHAAGLAAYNSADYNTAKTNLENAQRYITDDALAPAVFYYLGLTAEKTGDVNGARVCFQTVIDRYPASEEYPLAVAALERTEGDRP